MKKIQHKCDFCSKPIKGNHYPVYDENYNIQKGIKQCEKCYKLSIK
jgi:ribosome-binding protein aMBF1 (putative translation factor)